MLDGRLFFVAGYTLGGAPYGMFADEMLPYDVRLMTPESDTCNTHPTPEPGEPTTNPTSICSERVVRSQQPLALEPLLYGWSGFTAR
jgi:hypothetical protein